MPKSMVIDPTEMRATGTLRLTDIAVNRYKADIAQELKHHGKEGLLRIYRIMAYIREFETMLNGIKTAGVYRGVRYTHLGPAHLSIGVEATAVGLCIDLTPDDLIFGSHRSHGEVLAKCFVATSALAKRSENDLMSLLQRCNEEALRFIEDQTRPDGTKVTNIEELAERVIIYSSIAEIFGRDRGINRGLGGSMHMFFAPFGSMPNNAIVGASADIAVGAALYKRINRKPGIVMANIGDASLACGPVWEAMTLATMAQYHTLWEKELGGAPPMLFNIINNFYGMGGQTIGETMGQDMHARVGVAMNPMQMHAERIDGYNPLAVADAVRRKKRALLRGEGPALLDIVSYRLSRHSVSDPSTYRTNEEVAQWKEHDSLPTYGAYLVAQGIVTKERLDNIRHEATATVEEMAALATSTEISPRVDPLFIEGAMFSGGTAEKLDTRPSELNTTRENNPRILDIAKRSRFGVDGSGAQLPPQKRVNYRDALFEAMYHRFEADPSMVAFGEENRDWGGAFAVYRGLTEALPYHRLFNSSISEGAIVGAGVGYALAGGRAVVEIMYCDFMGRAGDEIFNQMAKWQAMSGGNITMPLTLRVSIGRKYGAQHSQDWSAMIAHMPGLIAMYPATPYDCKGMLNAALVGTDPVVFFESQKLYNVGEYFERSGVPEDFYVTPLGMPAVRRAGSDLTIVTLGPTLYAAIEAADELAARWQIDAEVIDLRFINPIDYTPILESVRKTGLLLLVTDAVERGSLMHTVATTVTQCAFDDLDGPPLVIGARNWITPAAEMEDMFFPQREWIIDAIHEQLRPLPGHTVTTVQTSDELLRRRKHGV